MSRLKFYLKSAVAAIGLSALCTAYALDLAELSALLSQDQLVCGRFIQEKTLSGFPKPMRTEGRFYLDLNRGIVWVTEKPFANTIIFSDSGLRSKSQYAKSHLSAQEIPYLKTVNELILGMLAGQTARLQADFEIKLTGNTDHWAMHLTARPNSPVGALFESMGIEGRDRAETIRLNSTRKELTLIQLSEQQAMKNWPKEVETP